MLEKPSSNHAFPIKHLYKDYTPLKKYLSGGSKRASRGRSPSEGKVTPTVG
jgi:hypothetical protein